MKGTRPRSISSQRGFSYIEVVFAIFLLATGASVVITTLPIANNSLARADFQNKAVGLAQKEIEAIRGLGYANVTSTQLATYGLVDSSSPIGENTYSFTNVDSAALDNAALLLPSGTATVTITQADIDLRQVSVTITWNERGSTRTFTDGTLIANL